VPPWTDQDIVLYHGTTGAFAQDILTRVDETSGGFLKDFGRGFYTTTRLDKAAHWASVKAARVGGVAAVIEFTVARSDLTALEILCFVRGDPSAADFWNFVQYCRTVGGDHNRVHSPWYDLVIGPVTGTWKRQTIIADADQISFHASASAALLDRSRKAQVL